MSKKSRLAHLFCGVVPVPGRAVDASGHQQTAVCVETECANRKSGTLCELADREKASRFLVHFDDAAASSWLRVKGKQVKVGGSREFIASQQTIQPLGTDGRMPEHESGHSGASGHNANLVGEAGFEPATT